MSIAIYRFVAAGALCAFSIPVARAQIPLPVTSKSGQFLVYGGQNALYSPTPRTAGVPLQSSLTAISCERIKSAWLAKLDAPDQWRGRILVVLAPAGTPYDLDTSRFGDGWQYRLQAPDVVAPRQFVRAVVRTLLLEAANRQARERSSEIPFWLADGLAEEIMGASDVELVAEPPFGIVNNVPLRFQQSLIGGIGFFPTNSLPLTFEQRRLAGVRECLQTNGPLTIEQLSWPENGAGLGVESPAYQASAQLLVHELLRLRDGPARMRTFIAGLPGRFNWQTSFLAAYRNDFDSLRTLEKWWLVRTAHFTGHTEVALPEPESWAQLGASLVAPVQIRENTNALPVRGTVSLQTVIGEWEMAGQTPVIAAKVRELAVLRYRLARPASAAADDYRAALAGYLNVLEKSGPPRPRSVADNSWRRGLRGNLIRTLDSLDTRRRQLAAASLAVAASPKNAVKSTAAAPAGR